MVNNSFKMCTIFKAEILLVCWDMYQVLKMGFIIFFFFYFLKDLFSNKFIDLNWLYVFFFWIMNKYCKSFFVLFCLKMAWQILLGSVLANLKKKEAIQYLVLIMNILLSVVCWLVAWTNRMLLINNCLMQACSITSTGTLAINV